jgi:type III pantothenate kinase
MNCIVLDQGNTSIKWGLFKEGVLEESGRILDSALDAALLELREKNELPFYFSSVRSQSDQNEFLSRFSFCKIIPTENFPSYKYSSGVAGKDRLANVAGTSKIFDGAACLIIDFGTCITYSIAQHNELHSGVISLGAQARLRGMNEFTGQLPIIAFSEIAEPFQSSTSGAMLSSVNFGILFELKGYIEASMLEFPGIQIVFTGTDAVHFAKQLNYRIFVELNLTLIGLYAISCANEV